MARRSGRGCFGRSRRGQSTWTNIDESTREWRSYMRREVSGPAPVIVGVVLSLVFFGLTIAALAKPSICSEESGCGPLLGFTIFGFSAGLFMFVFGVVRNLRRRRMAASELESGEYEALQDEHYSSNRPSSPPPAYEDDPV